MDYRHRVVPFYMTFQTPWFVQEEDNVLKDLEYLQQLYPAQAKRYLERISRILDKMDYEGSMIYDEYPDRWQLYQMVENIVEILKREEEELQELEAEENQMSPEKWEWVKDLVQIILFHEIYKRRHSPKSGFLKF